MTKTSDTRKRIGLLGVGSISEWHVKAIRSAGMEVTAVATRPGSKRLQDFAAKHGIKTTYPSWQDLLTQASAFDGLLLATAIDAVPEVLPEAVRTGLPILIEKPVAWTAEKIREFCRLPHDHVMVGYNRRFYPSTQFAREEVLAGGALLCQANFPETIFYPPKTPMHRSYAWRFFENCCHGIDLLLYLFGSLHAQRVTALRGADDKMTGFSATLLSPRGDIVELLGNWGTPANFSLTLCRPGRRVELLPFEVATVYEGVDILEPSSECPIRRYVPKAIQKINPDGLQEGNKPGFVRQAEAFRRLIETGRFPEIAARMEDALAVAELSESLLGFEEAKACELEAIHVG